MKPLVSIVMGSDSDLEIMNECAKALDGFDIPYEIDITSAVALLVRRPASPKKQPAAGSKSSSPQPTRALRPGRRRSITVSAFTTLWDVLPRLHDAGGD